MKLLETVIAAASQGFRVPGSTALEALPSKAKNYISCLQIFGCRLFTDLTQIENHDHEVEPQFTSATVLYLVRFLRTDCVRPNINTTLERG